MSEKTGRLIALGLFAVAASIVLAAVVYSRATPRYVMARKGILMDERTGEVWLGTPIGTAAQTSALPYAYFWLPQGVTVGKSRRFTADLLDKLARKRREAEEKSE